MAKEHQTEDQRIMALEQTLPGIQRALDNLSDTVNSLQFQPGSPVGVDFVQSRNPLVDTALLNQIIAILGTRNIFPAPVPPPPAVKPAATILADTGCIKVTFDGDPIKFGHTILLEPSGMTGTQDPNDCFTISSPLVYDGHAEVVICCKQSSDRDCSQEFAIVALRDPANPNPGTNTPRLVSALLLQFGCPRQPV